jgi:hypothetical protein
MGRLDGLQGYIYDIIASKGGVAYTRTTEELAQQAGEKYASVGSYVRTAILTLNVPAPTKPTAPPEVLVGVVLSVDKVKKEIFKEKIRMYVKTEAAIETAMKSLYDLIWGQCSESLRSRLGGDNDFATYSATADSLALLKAIRSEMTGFWNKQYLTHALHHVMKDFTTFSKEDIAAIQNTMMSLTLWYLLVKNVVQLLEPIQEPAMTSWQIQLLTKEARPTTSAEKPLKPRQIDTLR